MWDRIDAARRTEPRPRRTATWVGGGVIAAAAALALVVMVPRDHEIEPVPLTIADTTPLAGSLASGSVVRLSDASRIEVDDDARVDVLESSARTVALALREGRARFEVTPGGPRAWRIESGGVTVEVVGTVFTVERSGARVRVSVERGSVLVRGDEVPDHVQRLDAGESIEIGPLETAAPQREDAPVVVAHETIDVAAEEPSAPAIERRPTPAREDDEDPIASLLARADSARRRGDHAEAARSYEVVVREHADDQRAALAAYSLARMRLDRTGDPRAAARDFARALELGLPDQLAEGARAGRAIALARAGDARAAEALSEYLEAYPEGRYRGEVLRWQSEL
ncbi:FecR domain-containing protein [Sandaracinus amylolyticus]|uniref:FecR domain-containing protein n=1 Tax=Sandaracinus amylolyticus TaxID=927083 RepID=UPI001F3A9428|nr:FecR domain-containing protein [Sandaracinus amylolyticus]